MNKAPKPRATAPPISSVLLIGGVAGVSAMLPVGETLTVGEGAGAVMVCAVSFGTGAGVTATGARWRTVITGAGRAVGVRGNRPHASRIVYNDPSR